MVNGMLRVDASIHFKLNVVELPSYDFIVLQYYDNCIKYNFYLCNKKNMKKGILVAITMLIGLQQLEAQQFSFEMYFQDSTGNLDTIVLGYDTLGTEYIDTAFGELNVLNGQKKNGLDVRIVQYIAGIGTNDTIATKTQILPIDCDKNRPHIYTTIEITTNNWPVTASWDSTLFIDSCNRNSLLTSIHPGGWFDTGSPSDLYTVICQSINAVSFSSQVERYNNTVLVNENYAYLDPNRDTVSKFWFTFNYDFRSAIESPKLASHYLKVYPNPSTDRLYFTNAEDIESIECFATNGQQVDIAFTNDHIAINTLPAGIYYLQITLKTSQQTTKRFVKE